MAGWMAIGTAVSLLAIGRGCFAAGVCLSLCLGWMNRGAASSALHFIFVIATINIAGFSTDVISLLGMMFGLNSEQSKKYI